MNTIVYLIRHSEPFKMHRGIVNTNESLLIENEKTPLSINGEKLAEMISSLDEFKNLDLVYSSNYVRAMSTAKYFASSNNLKVNIDERFNERIHGVNSWDELPENFELNQLKDENYKIGFGESCKEVQSRMLEGFKDILNSNKGKTIAIITHATATTFLLKNWCELYNEKELKFNSNVIFDMNFNYCETFKLEFNEKCELINIENINLERMSE